MATAAGVASCPQSIDGGVDTKMLERGGTDSAIFLDMMYNPEGTHLHTLAPNIKK